jgi:hypothetical protein
MTCLESILTLLALALACIGHQSHAVSDGGGDGDRYNYGQWWMSSMDGDVEYQPVPSKLSPLAELHWRRLTYSTTSISAINYFSPNFNQYFTMYSDGSETYYDEYAQAWRALGFFVDCDDDSIESEGDGQQQQSNNNNNQQKQQLNQGTSYSTCRRHLLWAVVSILFSFQSSHMQRSVTHSLST